MDHTIDYAIQLDPDFANFYPAVPYPGTALYAKASAIAAARDERRLGEDGVRVLSAARQRARRTAGHGRDQPGEAAVLPAPRPTWRGTSATSRGLPCRSRASSGRSCRAPCSDPKSWTRPGSASPIQPRSTSLHSPSFSFPCRSVLLEIISVAAHAASAGPGDSRISIGPPVFRSFSGHTERCPARQLPASLHVCAFLWRHDLNDVPDPLSAARAVLPAKHPRIPGDPDHARRDRGICPLGCGSSAPGEPWCITATVCLRPVFSPRPSPSARARFRSLRRRLRRRRRTPLRSRAPQRRLPPHHRLRPKDTLRCRTGGRHTSAPRNVSSAIAKRARRLKGTAHGQVKNPRSPAATHGCESCHGPGQAHVEDDASGHMPKIKEMKPAEANQICLTCHNRADHVGWEGSAHERRNLTCTTCHSVHSPKSAEQQLVKATQTELCATCHRLQVAKTERAVAHMPVREGKMSCSSCHNPHGSISNVKNLKTGSSVSETVHQLPHGNARSGAVGARTGSRELRHLPRPARLVERPDAGRADADAVSALPCGDQASGHPLRQG